MINKMSKSKTKPKPKPKPKTKPKPKPKPKPKERTTAELFRICMKNGWVTLAECFREPELELFKN